jgi:hypothetical protein
MHEYLGNGAPRLLQLLGATSFFPAQLPLPLPRFFNGSLRSFVIPHPCSDGRNVSVYLEEVSGCEGRDLARANNLALTKSSIVRGGTCVFAEFVSLESLLCFHFHHPRRELISYMWPFTLRSLGFWRTGIVTDVNRKQQKSSPLVAMTNFVCQSSSSARQNSVQPSVRLPIYSWIPGGYIRTASAQLSSKTHLG